MAIKDLFTKEEIRRLRVSNPSLGNVDHQSMDLVSVLNRLAATTENHGASHIGVYDPDDLFGADPVSVNDALLSLKSDGGKLLSGRAIVLSGDPTIVIAVGEEYDGKPVIATLGEADGSLVVKTAVVAAGDLTITLSGNATADRDVFYLIDGR